MPPCLKSVRASPVLLNRAWGALWGLSLPAHMSDSGLFSPPPGYSPCSPCLPCHRPFGCAVPCVWMFFLHLFSFRSKFNHHFSDPETCHLPSLCLDHATSLSFIGCVAASISYAFVQFWVNTCLSSLRTDPESTFAQHFYLQFLL